MTQTEVEAIIGRLTDFVQKLTRYEEKLKLVGAGRLSLSQLRKLTDELSREAGGIRPIVEGLIGKRSVTQWGQHWYPWLEAFGRDYGNPRLSGAISVVIGAVNEAIGYLESKELIASVIGSIDPKSIQRPKILISHDGESEQRIKVEMECWRMMLEPIIVEEQASLDESVDNKVDRLLEECQFAIVLARLERGVGQDKKTIPRGNIIDEIGRIRAKLRDSYIILLVLSQLGFGNCLRKRLRLLPFFRSVDVGGWQPWDENGMWSGWKGKNETSWND